MTFFPITTYILYLICSTPSVKMFILLVIGSMLGYILYYCTVIQSLIWNVLFMFFVIVSESISMGFLLLLHRDEHISLFLEHSFLRVQGVVLSKLIHLVLIVFCIKLVKVESRKYKVKEVGVLLLQAFSSILCLIMVVEFSYYQAKHFSWEMLFLVLLGVTVLISYIVSYYLANQYFKYRDREEELLLIEMKNEKIISDYKALEKSQQKVYQLYHDLKKHLNVINMMENKAEMNEYLEKCFKGIQDMEGKFQTGNQYIDMVLFDEWRKAQELGIKVQFAVENGSLESIELHDVVIIWGNALENAREACIKQLKSGESAYMQLKIVKAESQTFIVISNSYTGELIRRNNVLFTSKEDKELHGIGMKSMRSSVEKYQGSMNIALKNQKFILTIMLNV